MEIKSPLVWIVGVDATAEFVDVHSNRTVEMIRLNIVAPDFFAFGSRDTVSDSPRQFEPANAIHQIISVKKA